MDREDTTGQLRLEAQNRELRQRVEELERECGHLKECTDTQLSDTDARWHELEEQLLEAQKMEAIGYLAGGVAHDLNNILGTVTALASVIKSEMDIADPRVTDLEGVLQAADEGKTVISDLLGFAGKGKYRNEIFSMGSFVVDLAAGLRRQVPPGVRLSTSGESTDGSVAGDYNQLKRALLNVCRNAAEAMPEGGSLSIELSVCQKPEEILTHATSRAPDDDWWLIRVVDSGVGMDEDTVLRAFEPFFTPAPQSGKRGLGLAMVYGTVRNHGGTVTLESTVGQGTAVSIYLPFSRELPKARAASASISSSRPVTTKAPAALLVDDEPMLLKAAGRLLEALGFEAIPAVGGEAAVEIFKERSYGIRVVILDMQMPDMDGVETFQRLRRINPDVPIFIASGYTLNDKVEHLLDRGAAGFINKPFDLRTLQELIC